jgi:hypothetical protein
VSISLNINAISEMATLPQTCFVAILSSLLARRVHSVNFR